MKNCSDTMSQLNSCGPAHGVESIVGGVLDHATDHHIRPHTAFERSAGDGVAGPQIVEVVQVYIRIVANSFVEQVPVCFFCAGRIFYQSAKRLLDVRHSGGACFSVFANGIHYLFFESGN